MIKRFSKEDFFSFFILIVGSALRLAWPYDFEWKFDQIWMFEAAHRFADGQPFNWLGMISSAGVPNPGLSVWVFIQLAKITKTPLGMNLCIQLINILCLWGFWFLFRLSKKVPKNLHYGILLMAVAPIPVFLSRNIWAQCLTLPFVLVYLSSYFYRERNIFSFLWGLSGLLIGQVHMAGFFLFLSVTATAFYFDFKNKKINPSWLFWSLGCLVAAIPMIPWLKLFLFEKHKSSLSFWEHFNPKIFMHALTTVWGININYLIGLDSFKFITLPIVGSFPTYLFAVYIIALAAIGLFTLVKAKKENSALFIGFLWVYFFSFMIAGASTYVHYGILVFPLLYGWWALCLNSVSKKLFWSTVLIQALLTLSLQYYIHARCGAENYGLPYRCQSVQLK